jgi:hypothetical protein
MAQKNRANMLTDIVNNIYNNLINFITGQNAQDRFVNLLDSSPNILSDASQPNGYVSTDANNEMFSSYYDEEISRADLITDLTANLAVGGKFYRINDAVGSTITLLVTAESNINLYSFGIDATTGEIGTYDITTDVFSPIVSSAQTLSDTLILGNTSGANDIEFDATQGLLFDNASRLREGTIDAGLGGLKGIAQICGAGYELKWENGRLYVMGSSGNTIRQSLYNLTTTPTVTDDDTLGYSVGSLWTLDDGTVYVCSDASTGAAVWAIGGIPNLQQVTDVGFTTTNKIISDNGAGSVSSLNNGTIDLTTGGATVNIDAALVTTAYIAKLPDKLTSPQTFAMMSDIGGLDLEVNGTPNVDQTLLNLIEGVNIDIADNGTGGVTITSLADRYKTSSLTSVLIGNNSKTFTVDANLAYIPLQEVLIVYDPSNHMHGTVTSYSGTTLVVDVKSHTGGGTFASWVINLDGIPIDAITGVGTVNEIAYFTSGQVIGSLAVATYPSLTELSYVKGATSAIQTQINGKMTNPMTTGGDIIYGGGSGAPTRLANGTAGQILQSNGTTLAPSWVAAPSGTNTQTLTLFSLAIVTPADSVNYFINSLPEIPTSIDARRAWKFTAAGTITAASFTLQQVGNGSGETVNIYLRNVTTATDTSIGTFTSNFGASTTLKQLFSGLSISVNTTDDYTIKIATPAWVTNPTNWTPSITLQQTV